MPPKKQKVEQVKGDEGKQMVRDYLKEQYRPFGVPDLILNMHNKIGKTEMTKLLDQLVEEGEIVVKTFGKTSFYCYREITEQEQGADCDQEEVNLETLSELKAEKKEKETTCNEFEAEISKLTSDPTDEELQSEFEKLSKEQELLKKDIEAVRGIESTAETIEYLNKLKDKYYVVIKEYHKRNKLFQNITSMVKEQVDDFKAFLANVGVEDVPVVDTSMPF